MQKRCGVTDMPSFSPLCLAVSGLPVCFLVTWCNEIKQSWFGWQVGLQEELRFIDIERLCLSFNRRAPRPAACTAACSSCAKARRPSPFLHFVLLNTLILHQCGFSRSSTFSAVILKPRLRCADVHSQGFAAERCWNEERQKSQSAYICILKRRFCLRERLFADFTVWPIFVFQTAVCFPSSFVVVPSSFCWRLRCWQR